MKKRGFLFGFSTILCSFIGLTSVSCSYETVNKEELVFNVTFDYGYDDKKEDVEVKLGEKVSKPTDPIRDGYEFINWTLNGEEYNFDSYVTKDITLIANYEKLPEIFTVTFDYGYDDKKTEVQVTEGETVAKPEDPVRQGYEFKTWTLNDEEYDFNNEVNSDITLLATYEKIPDTKCSVLFDYGYDDKTFTTTVNKGSKVEEPEVEDRETYIFKYWTLNGEKFDFNTEIEENTTLLAVWAEPITFETENAIFSFSEKFEYPNDNRASGGRSLSCLNAQSGDTITYKVFAEKTTTAILGIYCNTVDAFNFEDSFKLSINDEEKIIGQTTGTGWDGSSDGAYFDFRKPIVVNDISLNEGWNEIVFEVVSNMKSSTNFDRITLTSLDAIGGQAQIFEAEDAVITSSTASIETSSHASNGKYIGSFNNTGDKVSFDFKSSKATEANLGVDINLNDPIDLKNFFKITLNDVEITLNPNANSYWQGNLYDEFGHFIRGNVNLIEGDNNLTFEIICNSSDAANGKLNFDRIALFTESILSK